MTLLSFLLQSGAFSQSDRDQYGIHDRITIDVHVGLVKGHRPMIAMRPDPGEHIVKGVQSILNDLVSPTGGNLIVRYQLGKVELVKCDPGIESGFVEKILGPLATQMVILLGELAKALESLSRPDRVRVLVEDALVQGVRIKIADRHPDLSRLVFFGAIRCTRREQGRVVASLIGFDDLDLGTCDTGLEDKSNESPDRVPLNINIDLHTPFAELSALLLRAAVHHFVGELRASVIRRELDAQVRYLREQIDVVLNADLIVQPRVKAQEEAPDEGNGDRGDEDGTTAAPATVDGQSATSELAAPGAEASTASATTTSAPAEA